MNLFLIVVAGLLSGVAASMGIGGGGVLIIFLTVVLQMDQLKAQGINLLFFIPIAIFSIIIYHKRKLINLKLVLTIAILGFIGVVVGVALAGYLGNAILKKIFGGIIILISIREWTSKEK